MYNALRNQFSRPKEMKISVNTARLCEEVSRHLTLELDYECRLHDYDGFMGDGISTIEKVY